MQIYGYVTKYVIKTPAQNPDPERDWLAERSPSGRQSCV